MVADVVLADGLQQAERALHVGPQERLRVRDGVVVVGLRGVVHDRVMAGNDPIEQLRVADVADDELHAVGGQARDVLGVAGVGQLVQNGDVHVRVVVDHVMHEIRTDETAATGHDDVMGSKQFFSHNLQHIVRHTETARKDIVTGVEQSDMGFAHQSFRQCARTNTH